MSGIQFSMLVQSTLDAGFRQFGTAVLVLGSTFPGYLGSCTQCLSLADMEHILHIWYTGRSQELPGFHSAVPLARGSFNKPLQGSGVPRFRVAEGNN